MTEQHTGNGNGRLSDYVQWQRDEGVPIIERGHVLPSLSAELPLELWPRKGVPGAFIRLRGGEECMDAYILDLPPGASTLAERYVFEEEVFVVSGSGTTKVWTDEAPEQSVEWSRGSVFSPPMNTWRVHSNPSKTETARLLVLSNAPLILNVMRSRDFVFSCAHSFSDRYDGRDGYFSGQGRYENDNVYHANFVRDVPGMELRDYSARGAGGTGVFFEMAGNTIKSHVAEFAVGTYKKAHRHGPGAHIVILDGEGFTLLWEEGKPKERIDWEAGTMFALPDMWFHQHFNTGDKRARYFAVHYGDWRMVVQDFLHGDTSTRVGGHQIEYDDEDSDVLDTFLVELSRRDREPVPLSQWRR
jgi:quercetin dioxygenase-like cupin family protein